MGRDPGGSEKRGRLVWEEGETELELAWHSSWGDKPRCSVSTPGSCGGTSLSPPPPLTALQHVDWLVGCYGTAEWMLSLLPLACCLWGPSGAPLGLGLGLVPATVRLGALGQFARVAALKPSGYFSADTPWFGLGACSPSRDPFCQGHPEEGALGLAGLGWAVPQLRRPCTFLADSATRIAALLRGTWLSFRGRCGKVGCMKATCYQTAAWIDGSGLVGDPVSLSLSGAAVTGGGLTLYPIPVVPWGPHHHPSPIRARLWATGHLLGYRAGLPQDHVPRGP